MLTRGGAPETEGAPIAYLPWVRKEAVPEGSERAEPTLVERMQFETDEADRADALVLKKLARHGLSQREVEVALSHEFTPEQVQFNVARYIRLGYIDDARLAEHIVHVQRERKNAGRGNIRRELSARGIPLGIIEELLAELDDDTEFARAIELAASRLSRLGHESFDAQTRRVLGFLQRRGYSAGLSARALAHVRSEAAVISDDDGD
ncbi:MAG: regulatory protein RecX [Agromyces sp.]